MFKSLYRSARAVARHANGPLPLERSSFLSHLSSQGIARATLLIYASQLLVIASFLTKRNRAPIRRSDIECLAHRWARRRRREGKARTLKWPVYHFVQKGCAFCSFLGRLEEEPQPAPYYADRVDAWASYLRSDAGLSDRTVSGYRWWITKFFEWLQSQDLTLRRTTPARIDAFIEYLGSRGMGRVSVYDAVTALRRFFRYAEEQGWCPRDVAPRILSPRLFRYEGMPSGPSWSDVKRLIAATDGSGPRELRNRAMLLLLAVYALRCGEVTALRLDDLDWARRIVRVCRAKTGRVQEYPLTATAGKAIQRYLREARPQSAAPEVFLTLRAPFRRLSAAAVYEVTSSLFARLKIASPKRGPHALRHACASHLINDGLSLKAVGDHLGHSTPSATQVYAKVDLAGLRAVAAFDLGGLL